MIIKETENYRLEMIIADKTYYIIQKKVKNKWKFLFGVDSRKIGLYYLDNPEQIESKVVYYRNIFYMIISVLLLTIIVFIVNNQ